MRREASFDRTRSYRYSLTRIWHRRGTRLLFVMLNPSTADACQDDPTIRRCIGFAKRWGHGSLEVVNLYGFRTPHPRVLARAIDPVGPGNARAVRRAIGRAERMVAAWGNGAGNADADRNLELRVGELAALARETQVHCFGLTARGHPLHPLRLARDRPLVPWRAPPIQA